VKRASIALLVAVTLLGGSTRASALRGDVVYGAFYSHSIAGALHYAVYLPPDYASSTLRYPVVYYLHGLPASPDAYRNVAPLAEALERRGDEAIVVGAQGARDGETDPEYLDRGPSHKWETALTKELVATVDARFRTIRARSGRMIVGISAGGYGATLLALHHPGLYGAVEAWSGYFHATTPDGSQTLDLGSPAANARADARTLLAQLRTLNRLHTFFGFYVGNEDPLFLEENVEFHQQLAQAKIPALFRIYPGGHDWTLWAAHAAAWLQTGLAHARAAR
jgi:enterochelin esterase-like enzyme